MFLNMAVHSNFMFVNLHEDGVLWQAVGKFNLLTFSPSSEDMEKQKLRLKSFFSRSTDLTNTP